MLGQILFLFQLIIYKNHAQGLGFNHEASSSYKDASCMTSRLYLPLHEYFLISMNCSILGALTSSSSSRRQYEILQHISFLQFEKLNTMLVRKKNIGFDYSYIKSCMSIRFYMRYFNGYIFNLLIRKAWCPHFLIVWYDPQYN